MAISVTYMPGDLRKAIERRALGSLGNTRRSSAQMVAAHGDAATPTNRSNWNNPEVLGAETQLANDLGNIR